MSATDRERLLDEATAGLAGDPELRLEVRDAESIVGELVSRVAANARLESVRIARPTLDDVFLHYTGRALRE